MLYVLGPVAVDSIYNLPNKETKRSKKRRKNEFSSSDVPSTSSLPASSTTISTSPPSPSLPKGYCMGPVELSRYREYIQSGDGNGSSTQDNSGKGVWIQYPTGISNLRFVYMCVYVCVYMYVCVCIHLMMYIY